MPPHGGFFILKISTLGRKSSIFMKPPCVLHIPVCCLSQIDETFQANPYQHLGKLNPELPKEVIDYTPLIAICDGIPKARDLDQKWDEPKAFKYPMNSTALQDRAKKKVGTYPDRLRQLVANSSKWYARYSCDKLPTTQLSGCDYNPSGDCIGPGLTDDKNEEAPQGTYSFRLGRSPLRSEQKMVSSSRSGSSYTMLLWRVQGWKPRNIIVHTPIIRWRLSA